MSRTHLPSILRLDAIDAQIEHYVEAIVDLGGSIAGMKGLPLLAALKRDKLTIGPYSGVSLFEAANRIMTDLVLLYGVRWLLREAVFPFTEYHVEFGNSAKNPFDIMAAAHGQRLVGEAFNVAPSYFNGKKSAMLSKLREARGDANYSLVMFNSEAAPAECVPVEPGEYFVFVDVAQQTAHMLPRRSV